MTGNDRSISTPSHKMRCAVISPHPPSGCLSHLVSSSCQKRGSWSLLGCSSWTNSPFWIPRGSRQVARYPLRKSTPPDLARARPLILLSTSDWGRRHLCQHWRSHLVRFHIPLRSVAFPPVRDGRNARTGMPRLFRLRFSN